MIYDKEKRQILMVGDKFIRWAYFGTKYVLNSAYNIYPTTNDDRVVTKDMYYSSDYGLNYLAPGGSITIKGVVQRLAKFYTNYGEVKGNQDFFEIQLISHLTGLQIFKYKMRFTDNPTSAASDARFNVVLELYKEENNLLYTQTYSTDRYWGLFEVSDIFNYNFTKKCWEFKFPINEDESEYITQTIDTLYEPCYVSIKNLSTYNLRLKTNEMTFIMQN